MRKKEIVGEGKFTIGVGKERSKKRKISCRCCVQTLLLLSADFNIAKRNFMSQELEERFLRFAKHVRDFCQKLKQNTTNIECVKQLIKASASVGANYIEASDDLGKADEKMKIKTSRREVKEAKYFLSLV